MDARKSAIFKSIALTFFYKNVQKMYVQSGTPNGHITHIITLLLTFFCTPFLHFFFIFIKNV